MNCKKHGDIEDRTIQFSFPIQPIVKYKNGEEIKLAPYDKGKTFCLEFKLIDAQLFGFDLQ